MAASAKALLTLDDLAEGHNVFAVELSAEELDLHDEFFAFPSVVKAEVEVRRSMANFNLEGVVTCQISGDCYRCLKMVEAGVEARFRLAVQRRQASPEELASAEEDGYIEIVDPGTRKIDLRDYIREALILDLPIRIPTPDAKGHCPQCGDNLEDALDKGEQKEADPRWAALGKIEFSQTEEST
ncbi:MAG: DUF177 domain-containing protein [Candidatus Latescibacterota bacterium]|nr:DUF177 domain-containing protein [Candidatus Latescibacterota bacterium]